MSSAASCSCRLWQSAGLSPTSQSTCVRRHPLKFSTAIRISVWEVRSRGGCAYGEVEQRRVRADPRREANLRRRVQAEEGIPQGPQLPLAARLRLRCPAGHHLPPRPRVAGRQRLRVSPRSRTSFLRRLATRRALRRAGAVVDERGQAAEDVGGADDPVGPVTSRPHIPSTRCGD